MKIPNEYRGIVDLVGIESPSNAAAVDLSSADVTLTPIASALYIGVSGDVKVDMETSGTGIVFKSVPIGILRGRFKKVYKSGTGATNIFALW